MTQSSEPQLNKILELHIVDGVFMPAREIPFSAPLDALIAKIREAQAPNLGSFCGYCCSPLGDTLVCSICGSSVRDYKPREKVSRELAQIYHAKRRREARFVHGAAWLGITLGVAISTVLILVLPAWTKVFGVLFLIFGSYYIASYLGNVAIQNYAYRSGLRLFAKRWHEYIATRRRGALNDD